MKFDNTTIRRQDRLMSEEESKSLLRNGEFGYLSMIAEGDKPYGIPISYVWDGEDSVYFHSAPEGKKLRAIANNNNVSFCVVGHTQVIPEHLTTEFVSIVLKGTIEFVSDDVESMKALGLLLDKYSPEYKESGMKAAEKSLPRTRILRMNVAEWSGKAKKS